MNKNSAILMALIFIILTPACKNFQKRRDINISNLVSNMSVIKKDNKSYPAKENCKIESFITTMPRKKFKEIAHLAVSPVYQDKVGYRDIITSFKKKACLLGGDAVIIRRATELTGVDVAYQPGGTKINIPVPIYRHSHFYAVSIKYLDLKTPNQKD